MPDSDKSSYDDVSIHGLTPERERELVPELVIEFDGDRFAGRSSQAAER